jgi:hypothetical protein
MGGVRGFGDNHLSAERGADAFVHARAGIRR